MVGFGSNESPTASMPWASGALSKLDPVGSGRGGKNSRNRRTWARISLRVASGTPLARVNADGS